jgi:pilus assembly protein CpaF
MAVWPAPADRPVPSAADRLAERALREEVREELKRLLGEGQLREPGPEDEDRVRRIIGERVAEYQRRAAVTNGTLIADPAGLEQRLFDGLLRMGILQPYMDDPSIEELLINAPNRVLCIQNGEKRLLPDVCFDSDDDVRQLVKRLIGPLDRHLDQASPMVDARLADGSRLNAVIPPATTRYCVVAIRKFVLKAHTLDELVSLGTLGQPEADFLDAAVQARVNILVSGPTGSGKTTLLNCLGSCIPAADRTVTIEETAELRLETQLPDCVALQGKAGNTEGAGEIRIRELVRNALRMRPHRIIVGEVRGGEALDMLLALTTGHDGSLGTIHGSSPRDALDRLATLALMAEERLTKEAAVEMTARTIELVVQVRFDPRTGRRRVVSIFEVAGLDGGVLTGHEVWAWDAQAERLVWRGRSPRCLGKMAERGVPYAPPPVLVEEPR